MPPRKPREAPGRSARGTGSKGLSLTVQVAAETFEAFVRTAATIEAGIPATGSGDDLPPDRIAMLLALTVGSLLRDPEPLAALVAIEPSVPAGAPCVPLQIKPDTDRDLCDLAERLGTTTEDVAGRILSIAGRLAPAATKQFVTGRGSGPIDLTLERSLRELREKMVQNPTLADRTRRYLAGELPGPDLDTLHLDPSPDLENPRTLETKMYTSREQDTSVTMRYPSALIQRCDALIDLLQADPRYGAMGRVTRSGVIRLALTRGLEVLEAALRPAGDAGQ